MTTVTLDPVADFDALSDSEAKAVLYERIVPACECKGIHLSQYGNMAAAGTLFHDSDAHYQTKRQKGTLFTVADVKRAFVILPSLIKRAAEYSIGSNGLKHEVERQDNNTYISNGDTIAAMLLLGFSAHFKIGGGDRPDVNAEFKAAYMCVCVYGCAVCLSLRSCVRVCTSARKCMCVCCVSVSVFVCAQVQVCAQCRLVRLQHADMHAQNSLVARTCRNDTDARVDTLLFASCLTLVAATTPRYVVAHLSHVLPHSVSTSASRVGDPPHPHQQQHQQQQQQQHQQQHQVNSIR